MHASSYTPRLLTPDMPRSTRRRLAAAVVASALIHLWFAGTMSGGGASRNSVLPHAPSMTVSLARTDPAAATHAVLPDLPVSETAAVRAVAPVRQKARAASPATADPPALNAEPPAAGGTIPEAPDSTYYAARQLDVYPALTAPLDLQYARRALAAGVEGRALLLLHIDETGAVDDIAVVESQPAGYFEDDARRAFVGARFTPAQRNGRAVKSRVLVEVNYGAER
jgi:protein TonB